MESGILFIFLPKVFRVRREIPVEVKLL